MSSIPPSTRAALATKAPRCASTTEINDGTSRGSPAYRSDAIKPIRDSSGTAPSLPSMIALRWLRTTFERLRVRTSR